MPSRKGIYLLAGVGAVVAAMALFGVVRLLTAPDGGGRRADSPVPVVVTEVAYAEFVDRIDALGTAKANESVTISAKVTETIRRIPFADGQRVEAGQVLAELTDAEESAELASAQAALAEAQKQYARLAELRQSGAATGARLDTQLAARDAAAARVSAIEARLADRLIKAPFAGVVGLRAVSEGTLVRPGDVITTLDDISLIKLDFSVPETYLGALAVGQSVEAVGAAYPGRAFRGEVTAISPRVDPVTRAVVARAEIPNPDGLLKPGMLLTVTLVKNRRVAPAIPELALVPIEDKQFVFVVGPDGVAERREVRIGSRAGDLVEVLAGLGLRETVVVEGVLRVREGGTVAPTRRTTPGSAATIDGAGP